MSSVRSILLGTLHGMLISNRGSREIMRGDRVTKLAWEVSVTNLTEYHRGEIVVIYEWVERENWIVTCDKAHAYLGPREKQVVSGVATVPTEHLKRIVRTKVSLRFRPTG